MKNALIKMLRSRRHSTAVLAILCLTALGFYHGEMPSISAAISAIALGIAGANAYQKAKTGETEPDEPGPG